MKSSLEHVQLYIDSANRGFYKDMMQFLGWSIFLEEEDGAAGYKSGWHGDGCFDADIWVTPTEKKEQTDYDAIGINHVAIRVEKPNDIEELIQFLEKGEILPLFNTPRHRPEFAKEGETYYQVIFESPDKIQFEVVYIGPKT